MQGFGAAPRPRSRRSSSPEGTGQQGPVSVSEPIPGALMAVVTLSSPFPAQGLPPGAVGRGSSLAFCAHEELP